jgi:hypothetical protein
MTNNDVLNSSSLFDSELLESDLELTKKEKVSLSLMQFFDWIKEKLGEDGRNIVKFRKHDGSIVRGVVNQEREYISQGKLHHIFKIDISKNKHTVTLVVKERKDGRKIPRRDLKDELMIYAAIKRTSIPTFTTFRAGSDGKLYSTLLNRNNEVVISENNDLPVGYDSVLDKEKSIENFPQLVDKLIGYALEASAEGLKLESDAIWIKLSLTRNRRNKLIVNIENVLVTDFGTCLLRDELKGKVAKINLQNMRVVLKFFLDKYCDDFSKSSTYEEYLNEKIRPVLDEGQIFVQNEIKQFDEYNPEEDGEILDGNIILGKETTLSQLIKFTNYTWAELLITDVKSEYKNKIEFFWGSVEDDSTNIEYEGLKASIGEINAYYAVNFQAGALRRQGGSLSLPNCKKCSLESLEINEGSIVMGNVEKFVANSLREVIGELMLLGASVVSLRKLDGVARIILNKQNFKEFMDTDGNIDYKAARKAGKLVIPEKMINKIAWYDIRAV